MKRQRVTLSTHELRGLLFWARVGINYSISGSHMEAADLIPRLCKEIGFQLGRVRFKQQHPEDTKPHKQARAEALRG